MFTSNWTIEEEKTLAKWLDSDIKTLSARLPARSKRAIKSRQYWMRKKEHARGCPDDYLARIEATLGKMAAVIERQSELLEKAIGAL